MSLDTLDHSAIPDQTIPDGTVVETELAQYPFLIDRGKLRPIKTLEAFTTLGVSAGDVRTVPADRLDGFEMGKPVSVSRGQRQTVLTFPPGPFDSGKQFLGSGHYISINGTIDLTTGAVSAFQSTWTITMLGGFHGCCYLLYADANKKPVSTRKVVHTYGVDGTWIGQPSRTDPWGENIGAEAVSRLAAIYAYFSWNPDSFQKVLAKWDAAAKTVGDLASAAAGVAKVVPIPAPKPPGK